MKCLNCGTELKNGWGYCPGCGASANWSRQPEGYKLTVSISAFRSNGEFIRGFVGRQEFGPLYEMRELVAKRLRNGEFIEIPNEVGPGYIVSIDIPEHPHNYPHLVIL